MAVLGLRFCARAFSSCGKRGPLFIAVRGQLTIMASLVAEHRVQTRRLSSCGSRAQLLRGMWDLPRPGREPASPALAGRFSTTAPPGKPRVTINIRKNNMAPYFHGVLYTSLFLLIPHYVLEIFWWQVLFQFWLENQGKRVLRMAVNNCKNSLRICSYL